VAPGVLGPARLRSGAGPARAWLFGVARNVLSAHWRRVAPVRTALHGSARFDNPWEALDARLDTAAVAP